MSEQEDPTPPVVLPADPDPDPDPDLTCSKCKHPRAVHGPNGCEVTFKDGYGKELPCMCRRTQQDTVARDLYTEVSPVTGRHRFKKGNPGGPGATNRKLKDTISVKRLMRKIFRSSNGDEFETLIKAMLASPSEKTKLATLRWITNYLDGRPVETTKMVVEAKPASLDLTKLTVEEVKVLRQLTMKAAVDEQEARKRLQAASQETDDEDEDEEKEEDDDAGR